VIDFTAIVVGGGPAGLAAACLLGQAGVKTALVSGRADGLDDPRTVALMMPSIRLLETLEVWPGGLKARTCPLRKLRLIDDTGAMLAAPALTFSAEEMGEDAFGWNVPLKLLLPELKKRALEHGVAIIREDAAGLEGGSVKLSNGEAITASVILAADGRDSRLREAAGIRALAWSYDQCAIATSFAHSRPHRDVSTEYHTASGPFTTVPMPDNRSSLVWMERPARAAELMAMDDRALAAEIQLRCHGSLGAVTDIGPRKLFPMRGLTAQSFAAKRVLLLGEAAHVVPPIGAQGLNMSMRDAAQAAQLVADAIHDGEDPGGAGVMNAYGAARRIDVAPRQAVVDIMNRSLLAGFLPLDGARALGLSLLESFAPLRRFVMQRGLAPSSLPFAMRG
jgi:2-octaprenyl-6-methoxyphenol hydroxylase